MAVRLSAGRAHDSLTSPLLEEVLTHEYTEQPTMRQQLLQRRYLFQNY